jgi:hypothetical protein
MNTILEQRAMLDTRSSWTTRVFACDEMACAHARMEPEVCWPYTYIPRPAGTVR